MAKEPRLPGESRDAYLARTRHAGKKSASETKREKEGRNKRSTSEAPSRRSSRMSDQELYERVRQTPQSRKRRATHRRSIPSDAQSGGGESFADRSAWSLTKWWS